MFPEKWITGPKQFQRTLKIIKQYVFLKKSKRSGEGMYNHLFPLPRPEKSIYSNSNFIYIESSSGIKSFLIEKRVKRKPCYRGICPFHKEKTPSFVVFHNNDGSGSFKCFGCGKSGDVFNFLQEKHSMSFEESVLFLLNPHRGYHSNDPHQLKLF